METCCLRDLWFSFGVMKMFGNYIEVMVAQHFECIECHKLCTLKWLIVWHAKLTCSMLSSGP